jgi:hypothetical protein
MSVSSLGLAARVTTALKASEGDERTHPSRQRKGMSATHSTTGGIDVNEKRKRDDRLASVA